MNYDNCYWQLVGCTIYIGYLYLVGCRGRAVLRRMSHTTGTIVTTPTIEGRLRDPDNLQDTGVQYNWLSE
jgi:hypothetical protein